MALGVQISLEEGSLIKNEHYRWARFFSLISKESLLVGSPFSSEVTMMHPRGFRDYDDEEESVRTILVPSGVALSFDGKYRYVSQAFPDQHFIYFGIEETEDLEDYDCSVESVDIFNEEKRLKSLNFSHPFSLLLVREGVLVYNDKLAL